MESALAVKQRVQHIKPDEALETARAALAVAQASSQKIDKVLVLLGEEHEDGRGGFEATGLLGRLRRVEAATSKLFLKYQTWINMGIGFGTAGTLALTVAGGVWYFVSQHLQITLKQ